MGTFLSVQMTLNIGPMAIDMFRYNGYTIINIKDKKGEIYEDTQNIYDSNGVLNGRGNSFANFRRRQ